MAQVRALVATLATVPTMEIARVALVAGCALALIFAGQAAPY